jgi:hypothetical protein
VDIKIVKVGDTVRSYDFQERLETARNCYVEGVVVGFQEVEGCERYKIKTSYRAFGGEIVPHDDFYYPPVNGTPSWLGGFTNNVEVV